MQVTWPHLRMKRPAKHGWLFSAFAGIFAIASGYALLLIFSAGLPPAARQPSTATSMGLLTLFAMAFVAARVAGWIARVLGAEDYGWEAGVITAPLFLAFLRFLAAVQDAISPTPHNDLPYSHTWWILPYVILLWFVLPLCILGTAVFSSVLHLWSYHRTPRR